MTDQSLRDWTVAEPCYTFACCADLAVRNKGSKRIFAMSYFNRMLIAAAVLLPCVPGMAAEPAPLAELLAAEPTKDGLTLTVPTGGCTKKSDFEVTASAVQKGAAIIEVRRPVPDVCKGNFPDGLKLAFSWSDLNLPPRTKISVKNLVLNAPPPQPPRVAQVKHHKPIRHCAAFDPRSHLCISRHRARALHHHLRHRIHHHRGSKRAAVQHHAHPHARRHHHW